MSDIVFESAADQAGFVQLPNVVLMDVTLSMQARLLYGMLLHYARQDGACFPGQDTLAEKLTVTSRSVRNYLDELDAAKLIERRQRGQGKTCLYVILALGLRAKRLQDSARKPVSGGNELPAQPGNQFPTEVEAGDEEAVRSGVSARGRASMKVAGKPVNREAWDRTVSTLAVFNEKTGRSLSATTGTGQPSEAAKRIYSRLKEWPDLTAAFLEDVISRTLASRWWGSDPPSIGVVFGPKVFEENLTRPAVPSLAERRERRASNAERVDQRIGALRAAREAAEAAGVSDTIGST